jgi:hypothetical protein
MHAADPLELAIGLLEGLPRRGGGFFPPPFGFLCLYVHLKVAKAAMPYLCCSGCCGYATCRIG